MKNKKLCLALARAEKKITLIGSSARALARAIFLSLSSLSLFLSLSLSISLSLSLSISLYLSLSLSLSRARSRVRSLENQISEKQIVRKVCVCRILPPEGSWLLSPMLLVWFLFLSIFPLFACRWSFSVFPILSFVFSRFFVFFFCGLFFPN